MNWEQYYHQGRPQNHGLPQNYSYDGSNIKSYQPSYHQTMSSYDGLPREQQYQQSLDTISTSFQGFDFPPTMPIPTMANEWVTPPQNLSTFDQHAPIQYNYSHTIAGALQDGVMLRNQLATNVPRSCQGYDASMLSDYTMPSGAYESSDYMLEPTTEDPRMDGLSYEHHNHSPELTRMSISPKIENDTLENEPFSLSNFPPARMPESDSSDDSAPSSREMTAVEVEDHSVDEPYAKLIYRALMSAPDHAMVLQEIYQWFRDNTTKGSSDTKGWMNSIRHNLSMNAAFKKTERKVPGDETKKSTEWVLEEFAIKDGVQSTTRYRKGTGNKKFTRTGNPAPSRQSSGQKGGRAANAAKLQRQKVRDDTDFGRPTPRIDTGMRQQIIYDNRTPQTMHRHISPQTPESIPWSSQYAFPKDDRLEMPYGSMYSLGDVHGVVVDDNSPLFSNDHSPTYHDPHPISTVRF